MTVAIVITEHCEPAAVVRWAMHFARARDQDLLLLQAVHGSGPKKVTDLIAAENASDHPLVAAIEPCLGSEFTWEQPPSDNSDTNTDTDDTTESTEQPARTIRIRRIQSSNLTESLLEEIAGSSVSFLILPRPSGMRSTAAGFEMERQLFRDAHCETMQLRLGETSGETCQTILVPAGGGHHTTTALNLATDIADANDGKVTALYVEPYVDAVAELVGQRIVERVVSKALGANTERVSTQVVLADKVARGIALARDAGHDLLLLGVAHHGAVHRLLFPSISEELMLATSGPTVAIVRPAIPLASRIRQFMERLTKSGIPQLDRQQRVALVERVQSSSRWDIDFLALTCLSTLIAALGLVQNSAAVVIGAMLVAPLMTPLLGAGLSLVQGNVILVRYAALSVFRGFFVAFAIGIFVGLLTPNLTATSEMLARGSPRIPDLMVGFVSGIAAAYAIGRPNLLSALPGVAIAAALVPPLATAGLATSLGRWNLALGALVLFLTNIVAIVIGAACSLWAVGIRGQHEHGGVSRWARAVSVLLILLAVGLAVYEAWPQYSLPSELHNAIKTRIDKEPNAHCLSVEYDGRGVRPRVDVVVASPSTLGPPVVSDLVDLAAAHYGDDVQVRMETRLTTTAQKPQSE